jgi:signal transduction histidine kinase
MTAAGTNPTSIGPILLVEDDDVDAERVVRMLRRAPDGGPAPECVRVALLSDAVEIVRSRGRHLVLLDLMLPDSRGLETLDRLLAAKPGPVVVMSGLEDRALALEAVRHGAQDYLVKERPGAEDLWKCLVYASERDLLQRELAGRVDELASLNVELERHREELARAHRQQLELKDQLLSHVSHELRTPLTALHQLVGVVRDGVAGPVNAEQHEYLSVAHRNAEQLARMIDDLVDVARATADKLRVELQVVSLASLVRDTVESFAPRAGAAGLRFGHDLPSDLPPVLCDPVRVRQVLSNLVDNALKFTHQGGGVLVSARRDPEHPGMLRISVTDDGSGMSEEALERIFDRLHQEPVAHEVGTGRRGLGLGLYIARQLVERHGGRIWADSRRGAGSTFHFTLAAWSLADTLRPVLWDDRRLRRPGWLQVRIAPRQSGLEAERLAPRIRKGLRAILGSRERLLPCTVEADGTRRFAIVFDADDPASASLEDRVAAVFARVRLDADTSLESCRDGGEVAPQGGDSADLEKQLAAVAARLEAHLARTI